MKRIFFVSTILLAGILLVACNCTDCEENEVKEECLTQEQCYDATGSDEQSDVVYPESILEGSSVTDSEQCYDTICPGKVLGSSDSANEEDSNNIDNQ